MNSSVDRRRLWKSVGVAVPVVLVVALSGCSSTSPTRAGTTSTTSASSSTTAATTSTTGVTPVTAAGGTVATGSVTCTNVTGTITFTPPLTNSGTSAEATRISLAAAGCTTAGSTGIQVASGTATATITSPTNGCVSLLSSKPVVVAVAWSPSSIHASVASFGGYAIVTDAAQHTGFGLPNAKGTASVDGSFAGTDHGATSTAATYSSLTTTQLLTACGTTAGLAALTIASGTVTLS
ncbi:MAG TPA: hypothetical protein VMV22_07890 [Acidimicrobiales bacterium]|nr:hypothetical protein [Acidimicrobiales bacterium]